MLWRVPAFSVVFLACLVDFNIHFQYHFIGYSLFFFLIRKSRSSILNFLSIMANRVVRSASTDCLRNIMTALSRSRAFSIDTERDGSICRQLDDRIGLISGVQSQTLERSDDRLPEIIEIDYETSGVIPSTRSQTLVHISDPLRDICETEVENDPSDNVENGVSFYSITWYQPIITLNRLPSAGLVALDNRVQSSSGVPSEVAQVSDSMECAVFERYEFLAGFKKGTQLLYVHDIGHLYLMRNKSKGGVVYQCRLRTKCDAKVRIDEFGVCKQYTSASHSHPSVRGNYENLIFRHRLRDIMGNTDFAPQNRNLRKIYDEQRRL